MSLEQQFPVINFPTISNEYKIVQLELDEKYYLLFSKKDYCRHSDILLGFLKESTVPFNMIKVRGLDITSPIGNRYKVLGAGMAKVDTQIKQALFYGSSHDYCIGMNKEHLYLIRTFIEGWELELEEIVSMRKHEILFARK